MFFFLKPIKWAIKLFVLAVFAGAVFVVVEAVGVVRAEGGSTPPAGTTDAAIVVTGSALSGNAPSADLLGRLEEALLLYHGHAAPTIVVAGPSEATVGSSIPTVAASWLRAEGVQSTAIDSVTTSSESEYVNVAKSIGKGAAVIVVTDAADVRWALDAADGAGLSASGAVVPGSKKLFVTDLPTVFREASGVAAGRLIGYDHTSWAAN